MHKNEREPIPVARIVRALDLAQEGFDECHATRNGSGPSIRSLLGVLCFVFCVEV